MSVTAQWSQVTGSTAAHISTEYAEFAADLSVQAGGAGKAPTPHDLLNSALAACTVLTLQVYSQRKAYSLAAVSVGVAHQAETGKYHLQRSIRLQGQLSAEQINDLLRVANACPVHKTLQSQIDIVTDIA